MKSARKSPETGSEFVAVIHLQLLPLWYELSASIQREMVAQLNCIMERYKGVHFDWFDADAWTSELTDFVLFEFVDISEYNALWNELRRHPFLATPYARIEQLLMGMELEVEGLARLADDPEFCRMPIEFGTEVLSLPPGTSKPEKPERSPLIKKPPTVTKPVKSGKKLKEPEVEQICHFCGHIMKKRANFCSRCGTSSQ